MNKARVKRIDGIITDVTEMEPVRCMGHCGGKFVPVHRFNKICPSCDKHNQGINGREYRATRAAE